MIKPKYYKCDICEEATTNDAFIKTKKRFTLKRRYLLEEGLNGEDIICDNCFNKLVEKINAERNNGTI